jgi:hypothetical protein
MALVDGAKVQVEILTRADCMGQALRDCAEVALRVKNGKAHESTPGR